ncbi:accessory factor UbiK family protein [Hoeflea sp. WL0058]|uniref:Accessory factor UbiK family protein n=1 Tax=Flavimaribacter sediminis TaxID=2865987 RepID=A0AAE3D2G8_9HYPH|nr:accessory factor UbiK family protein [Flavimaribacter sediminis]MBW8638781.1 accessory factor UbiK family protein [Flavimaribacter sediminis]
MTSGPNRFMDEFARLMTDAAGVAQSARNEMETAFKTQMERVLAGMDVVQREEFEAVREMAVKARDENEALAKRIDELEAQLSEQKKAAKSSTTRKKTAPDTAAK